jgi:hypothetical protein
MALTIARQCDGKALRIRPTLGATDRNGLRLWGRSDVARSVFEGGDEAGQVRFGDSSRFPDLDASELPGSEEQIDLVAADVQQVRDLFHGYGSCRSLPWRLVGVGMPSLVGLHAGLRRFPR